MQSSTFTIGHPQADGRCQVIERHIDNAGIEHVIEYGPVPPLDYAAAMAERAAMLAAQLAEAELTHCLDTNTFRFIHQTRAEFAGRLRARFRESKEDAALKIASWVLNRLDTGEFTDPAVQATFGLTSEQYVAFKQKWTALRDQWLALQKAVGE